MRINRKEQGVETDINRQTRELSRILRVIQPDSIPLSLAFRRAGLLFWDEKKLPWWLSTLCDHLSSGQPLYQAALAADFPPLDAARLEKSIPEQALRIKLANWLENETTVTSKKTKLTILTVLPILFSFGSSLWVIVVAILIASVLLFCLGVLILIASAVISFFLKKRSIVLNEEQDIKVLRWLALARQTQTSWVDTFSICPNWGSAAAAAVANGEAPVQILVNFNVSPLIMRVIQSAPSTSTISWSNQCETLADMYSDADVNMLSRYFQYSVSVALTIIFTCALLTLTFLTIVISH